MSDKAWIGYKDLWNDIFKFLDINGYMSLELSNKSIREKMLTYYQLKTKDIPNLKFEKNPKKLFFQKYLNSFVIFHVKSEYNALECLDGKEPEKDKTTTVQAGKKRSANNENFQGVTMTTSANPNLVGDTTSQSSRSVTESQLQSQFIDNTQTTDQSMENSLFTQQNIVQQIVVKNERIYVLYHNADLKVFSMDMKGNFSLELKFNFGSIIQIQKFQYISSKCFLLIDNAYRLYSFHLPSLQELVELGTNDIVLSLTQITGLGICIKDIYYITDYLLVFDTEDNLYYIHEGNLVPNDGGKKEETSPQGMEESIQQDGGVKITTDNTTKLIPIERTYGNIIKISSAEDNFMLLDDTYQLHYLTTNDLNKPGTLKRSLKIINDFSPKYCTDMASGENHWLVLEKEEVKPLAKWDCEDVQKWFQEMEMDEYVNIAKYEKINGKDILGADESFYVNVMGMMDDQIKKVNYEISNAKNGTCKKTRLWGWGSNKCGQLGQINYNHSFSRTPTLINLPEMKTLNDSFVKVYCGKTYSILLTKFGEIFITGNYSLKDKVSAKTASQQISTSSSHGGKKNKLVDKSKMKETQSLPSNCWVSITREICFDIFEKQKPEAFFRAKEIHPVGKNIFVFGYKSTEVPFTLMEKRPKFKHLKKGEKFITSDAVIEGIISHKKNSINKFTVVYSDALLKMCETALEAFQASDIPYHKIEQIKYYNNIVWDRKKRFYKEDLFNI